jgi:hydrophobic/amphiphilic exporter-1 (mainly G- bacteria), HAE1 family
MWLTNLAIKRPVVILMLFAALIVLGWRSRSDMAVDLYPKIDFPFITVTTIYPGAGPEEIETLISKPIEDAVGSVNGMKNIQSTSMEGISNVGIELELGTNTDTALSDVRAKVDAVRMSLPDDAKSPVVSKFDIGSMPILYMGISSKRPAQELRQLADDVIKDRLGKVKGVASVTITGGDQREIQVNVDKSRLEAYGLSIDQVTQALSSGNLNLPSGRIKEGNREYSVRTVGEFSSADEIRNLKINFSGGTDGGRVLTIGDIAQVADTTAERESAARLQKKDSVGITIQKQSDANTVDVAEGVKKELEAMKSVLPKDVSIAVSYDQSNKVLEALADVNVSLVLGALLAVLIVFLFLHNIRGTFIVAVAIPASMIAAFIPISFGGFTMNMMVMLAFSLAVGILVDDSIVVLENIYRHLSKGEEPAQAALNGRSEIGLAAITITMVDVVVFLPIAFMGGIAGMFFREFGITVAVATLFSLLVSFTLTPMLASRWYRKNEAVEASTGIFAKFDQFYHMLDTRYRGLLAWALRHRWQVVVAGFVSLVVILMVVSPFLGFEMFPKSDEGRITTTIEMPVGTSLQATDAVAAQVENVVSKIPEVDSVFTTVGSTQGGFHGGESGANYSQVTISLREKESVGDRFLRAFQKHPKRVRTDQEIAQEIRRKTAGIPGGRVMVQTAAALGGGGSAIDIELTGSDMAELNTVAQKIKPLLASTEGVINTDVSWKVGKPEVKASVDRIRAAELDLTVGQIASALRTSIDGSTDTHFRENGKEYDIRVRLNKFDRYSLSDVGRIVVGSVEGTPIFLQDISQITRDTGPTKIERKNRQRKVSVTADLAPGYQVGNVARILGEGLKGIPMGGVHMNFGGEEEHRRESMGDMGSALMLSVVLVFMLMAALFESFLTPLIIMFSLPMALIGAILALGVTGESLSIISMIGFIMLMGLVTKNAILLVDYTNTLRGRGYERNTAILEAGPTRLRPILMTTFAMIFGMLPTALKLGRGSEMRAPMAIAVIGGLIVSTLLTLVVIPTLYTLMDDLATWWHRKWQAHHKRADDNPSSNGDGHRVDKMPSAEALREVDIPDHA